MDANWDGDRDGKWQHFGFQDLEGEGTLDELPDELLLDSLVSSVDINEQSADQEDSDEDGEQETHCD